MKLTCIAGGQALETFEDEDGVTITICSPAYADGYQPVYGYWDEDEDEEEDV